MGRGTPIVAVSGALVFLFACGRKENATARVATEGASASANEEVDAAVVTTNGPPPAMDASAPTVLDAAAPLAAPDGCKRAPLAGGNHRRTVVLGGVARTYDLHVPVGYTGKSPTPVVFEFHPLKVAPGQWELATGWAALSDQEGFLVAWPHGAGESWNVGRCCDPALAGKVDDVAFVRAVLTHLQSEACVDGKRVYASGCSNGGGMSYRLACDAADVIAAVAPVDFDCMTGATNTPSCANCNPSRPISVAQFRGTADPLVPYGGGPTLVVPNIVFPGAQATFAEWATRNVCSGAKTTLPGHPACETYGSCAGGAETTLCTIPNGLHCTEYLSFGTASIAWEMFERHAMP